MSVCSGTTKTGNGCSKKIKLGETHCHLHKDQGNNNNNINDIKTEIPIKLKVRTVIDNPNILNIWTWNINSVRKKIELVDKLLIKHNIDVLLLTETKIQPKLENELIFHENYNCIWNSNKNTYHHGVAFVYKKTLNIEILSNVLPILDNEITFENKLESKNYNIIEKYKPDIQSNTEKAHNTEGRILTIKLQFNNKEIIIVGTYVPNSGSDRIEPLKRLGYRISSWDKDIYNYLLDLHKKYENIIWTGDLNVTIKDNDLLNVKANVAGTTTEERHNINSFLEQSSWIDTWELCNPSKNKCKERATWGMKSSFPMRLDYVICSPSLKDNCVSSFNDQKYDGSDHIPIGVKVLII